MKNLNRKLSFGVALAMTSAILSCVPSVSASASSVYGDVDGDGKVTIGDVVGINKYLAGVYNFTGDVLCRVDFNHDFIVDQNDVKNILSCVLIPNYQFPICNQQQYEMCNNESRKYIKYDVNKGRKELYTLNKLETYLPNQQNSRDRYDNVRDYENINTVFLNYDKGGYGSGFIVDDHIIATAAHCVYDDEEIVSDFTIKIWDENCSKILKEIKPKEIHFPELYTSTLGGEESNYDYALVYVDEDLSEYGIWSLGTVTDSENSANDFYSSDKELIVSGFTKLNDNEGIKRYYSRGEVVDFTSNPNESHNKKAYRINCLADSSGGKSGGPMYYEYNYKGDIYKTVVGVYTGGTEKNSWSVRITPTLLQFYRNNNNI